MKNNRWAPQFPPSREYKRDNLRQMVKISQFIFQVGEVDALRQPNKKVPVRQITSPVMKQKIAYLKRCFLRYKRITHGKGRGISGVQVGFPEQVFVVYFKDEDQKLKAFINPRITKRSKKLLRYKESCMSANSLVAPVVRPSWIEFEYYDEQGKKQKWTRKDDTELNTMYNRIVEHEIDHLHGIINIDRVKSKELVFESDLPNDKKPVFKEVKTSHHSS